jgi:pimeloyl-ACP methyl ester carboxylesterase
MLVLMGGMAQPLNVWEPTARALATTRNTNVLLVEPLGVGDSTAPDSGGACDSRHGDASMGSFSLPAQARALYETIQSHAGVQQPLGCDVVGFSLGARILMAYSSWYPVRKMHLTGIAAARSDIANAALQGWMTGEMGDGGAAAIATATSILQTTYSNTHLQRNMDRIPQWVNFIEQQGPLNRLLQDTQDVGDWSVANMARRCSVTSGQLVVGEEDLMAPPHHAASLTRALGWRDPTIVMGAGHAVPFESPREWRRLVLDYLDS